MVSRCPIIVDFQFKKNCTIPRCLHHTTQCNKHCLLLGTRVSDTSSHGAKSKNLSLAEIQLYKANTLNQLSKFAITSIKKKSLDRIKNIMALSVYIDWLNKSYSDEILKLRALKPTSLIGSVLREYPFSVKPLDVHIGTLPYILNIKTFKVFIRTHPNIALDSPSLSDLLEVDSKTLTRIRGELKVLLAGN